jgi:hypothetical protein
LMNASNASFGFNRKWRGCSVAALLISSFRTISVVSLTLII